MLYSYYVGNAAAFQTCTDETCGHLKKILPIARLASSRRWSDPVMVVQAYYGLQDIPQTFAINSCDWHLPHAW